MIEVARVTKDYGTVLAVSDLSFSVNAGEVVGFLGPNGAGKTTTLRILAGSLGATSGRVRINGHDTLESALRARQSIGYMPESVPLYPEMRVFEYLMFRAALKGVPRRARREAVERALEQAGATSAFHHLIAHLSKGFRQRVGLADALLGKPPLLVLDEPTSGLDPNQIREVRTLVRELGKSHTILLSTHLLSEVESTCDRAIVIHRGRLVAEGTLEELRALRAENQAELVLRGDSEIVRALLGEFRRISVLELSPNGDTLRLSVQFSEDASKGLEELIAACVTAGVGVRRAALKTTSLEDVFIELTSDEPSPPEGSS